MIGPTKNSAIWLHLLFYKKLKSHKYKATTIIVYWTMNGILFFWTIMIEQTIQTNKRKNSVDYIKRCAWYAWKQKKTEKQLPLSTILISTDTHPNE